MFSEAVIADRLFVLSSNFSWLSVETSQLKLELKTLYYE